MNENSLFALVQLVEIWQMRGCFSHSEVTRPPTTAQFAPGRGLHHHVEVPEYHYSLFWPANEKHVQKQGDTGFRNRAFVIASRTSPAF